MKRIRKKFCRLKNTENENENHLNLFYIEEVIKFFLVWWAVCLSVFNNLCAVSSDRILHSRV